MTETSTSNTIAVPCPDCGEMSPEPVARLCEHEVIPCSYCGGLIDLADESCKSLVEEARARQAVQ